MKESCPIPILLEINETTTFQHLYTKVANSLQFHEKSKQNRDEIEQHNE